MAMRRGTELMKAHNKEVMKMGSTLMRKRDIESMKRTDSVSMKREGNESAHLGNRLTTTHRRESGSIDGTMNSGSKTMNKRAVMRKTSMRMKREGNSSATCHSTAEAIWNSIAAVHTNF